MKRILFYELDWPAIQREYDIGYGIQTVCKKFAMSPKSINKAIAAGLFKSRTPSDSANTRNKMYPRDYSAIRAKRTAITNYRGECSFKFNLATYPDEFDFALVTQYGWYSAKNRGNNSGGVSRDHMVSVRYGFDNKVDPKIISHPANCALILHRDNTRKQMKCSITLRELMQRISEWDSKYK